jgi:hypothetical protein
VTIRIILGGPLRGNEQSWSSLEKIRTQFGGEYYIGNDDDWIWETFPYPINFARTELIVDSPLALSEHSDRDKYIGQWSNLYGVYQNFVDKFSDDDVIMKLRNDIVIENFSLDLSSLEDNCVYVPSVEFHSPGGFDVEKLCNDQIVIGKKKSMSAYFDLPKKFKWDGKRGIGAHGLEVDPMFISIETILKRHLDQQGVKIKLFPLTYWKI